MKTTDLLVIRAEQRAAAARAKFNATFRQLRNRVDPRVIVSETTEAMIARGTKFLDDAESAVKGRPYTAAGGVIAVIAAVAIRIFYARGKSDDQIDEDVKP